MLNALLLGGLALVVAVGALVVGVIALVFQAGDSDESDGFELHLSDRGKFTVNMVARTLQRYEDTGREATVNYYNSPGEYPGGMVRLYI